MTLSDERSGGLFWQAAIRFEGGHVKGTPRLGAMHKQLGRLCTGSKSSVMPAKAGIQYRQYQRVSKDWIPAFAGMTTCAGLPWRQAAYSALRTQIGAE